MKKILFYFVIYYLRFFAKLALFVGNPTVIGIAGSVGKSSTKQAIFAVLQDYFPTKYTPGNSETGVPLGILGIEIKGYSVLDWLKVILLCPFKVFSLKGTKILIVEMGTDEPTPPRNMEYLLSIVKPQIAIYLNAQATHTQQFEKVLTSKEKTLPSAKKLALILQAIAHEDGKIITQSDCQKAIFNQDDPLIENELKNFSIKENVLVGFGNKGRVSLLKYSLSLKGSTFQFKSNNDLITIDFPNLLLPKVYADVFAPALIIGQLYKLSKEKITRSLEKNFTLPNGRSSLFTGINNSVIIDSSYNASKNSVLTFLELIRNLKEQEKRTTVFVFGDMRELGDEAAEQHLTLIPYLHQTVDYLYCVGPLTYQFIYSEILKTGRQNKFKEVKHFFTAVEAGRALQKQLPDKSVILVKGSQNEIFLEELIKYILADSKDAEKLCRQSEFWQKKKSAFFQKKLISQPASINNQS